MSKTQLKKLVIKKFRALNNVEVEFGDFLTVVCGKNGTSKSSILGIAAQIFSFEKDYEKSNNLSFREIAGGPFKSQYSEHFRISNVYDVPGSMEVQIELHDGYSDGLATAKLELMSRGKSPRPVVRNNSTAKGSSNKSRNFTHPVIFLSLKRLLPIADRTYEVADFDYLNSHEQEFIGLTNELLNRSSSSAKGTSGSINSAVAHGHNYDQNSVSAGEDNAGQIVLALMSFKKLKEEYSDYRGGLLLIDEADAGLFPTAQINLLNLLDRECRLLGVQVVMTSHSPVMIEHAFEQSQKFRKRYKTIYLSNTFGDVQVMQDWSWPQISADIHTRTLSISSEVSLPKAHVYFEDKEGADFFGALLYRQPIKKFTSPLDSITLGASNYIQLISKGIREFSSNSIVCLDADQAPKIDNRFKTIVLLPGDLPPDQLIFEHLYNLPAGDDFWKNELFFSRDVFTRIASDVIREFSIQGPGVDIRSKLEDYAGEKKPREVFKRFYKDAEFQRLINSRSKPYNPWRHWVDNNSNACNTFLQAFKSALQHVMKEGFAVDPIKLSSIDIKLKKV